MKYELTFSMIYRLWLLCKLSSEPLLVGNLPGRRWLLPSPRFRQRWSARRVSNPLFLPIVVPQWRLTGRRLPQVPTWIRLHHQRSITERLCSR